jgi:hypothetical protein
MSRQGPKESWRRQWFAPGDVLYVSLMEAEWTNLSEKADIAYELGMYEEAEVIDAHADALAEWLDGAIAEIEEGGDLDVFGQEAEPSIEEELSELYRRYLTPSVSYQQFTRDELVRAVRNVLVGSPTVKHDISDDIIVEAARDAYEARQQYRLRLKKNGQERYLDNPPSWVTDEKAWKRAESIVWERWDDYEEPYAVVAHIYKRIVAKKERDARSARASKAAKARWKKSKSRRRR